MFKGQDHFLVLDLTCDLNIPFKQWILLKHFKLLCKTELKEVKMEFTLGHMVLLLAIKSSFKCNLTGFPNGIAGLHSVSKAEFKSTECHLV